MTTFGVLPARHLHTELGGGERASHLVHRPRLTRRRLTLSR